MKWWISFWQMFGRWLLQHPDFERAAIWLVEHLDAALAKNPRTQDPTMIDVRSSWLSQYPTSTSDSYRRDLAQFETWLKHTTGETNLLEVARVDVQNWLKHLRTRRYLTDPTIRREASSLSSFFEYCAQEGHIDTNPARRTKRPKGETAVKLGLPEHQVRKLVTAALDHSPSAYALTLLLVTSALRISEAIGIDVDHITDNMGYPVIEVTRKGGTRERVRIAPIVRQALLVDGDNRDEGPIFLGPKQHRLSRRAAGTLIRELGETAGIGHVTPYLLRHTAATNAIQAGEPLEEVQALGHKNPATTQRYIQALETTQHATVDHLADIFTAEL